MSETYRCGDYEALVGYAYDECEAAEREAIAAHVAACPACAEELESLGATRRMLSAWTPPEARLGFRITERDPEQRGARVLRPQVAWWRQPLPAWAQIAAAVVIFASGVALGVERSATPAIPSATLAASSAPVARVKPVASVTPQDLAAVEQRLRSEMAQIRQTAAEPVAATDDAALLRRVRDLINDSEQRERQEFALQTAQVVRSLDAQRRIDMAQMQRNIGQIQEVAGAAVRGQSQMVNYLMNVSQQR